MLQADQLINEKYRVLDQAGTGDLGPVYRVLDVETEKICALKTLQLPGGTSQNLFVRLLEDTDKIQNLRHPHIVSPGRLEEMEGSQPFFVREFFEGITLKELIQKEAPLPIHRACSIARQIAQALEAAHHAGIVHGDLKPSSVLLVSEDSGESAKVLGFGLFSIKQDRFVDLSRLALKDGVHHLIGAPEYISPEQAMGSSAEVLDGRSDLYSLGVIWHQMLAGEAPFRGDNAMEILLAHLFTEPQSLCNRPELAVPETLDRLLMRTLAKKREDRPASATALIDQLTVWEEPAAPSEFSKPLQAPVVDADWAPRPQQPVTAPSHSAPDKLDIALGANWKSPTPAPVILEAPALAHMRDQTSASQEPAIPEPPRMPPPAALSPEVETPFIADIRSSPPATEETRESPLDIPLHEETPPSVAPTPAQAPAVTGPIIFGNYMPRERKPRRKGLPWWAAAAIVIVILLGAGCGWLYYSGRTYWFRPDYAKLRISTFLASFSIPERGAQPSATPPAALQPAPSTSSAPASAPAAPKSPPPTATPETVPSSITPMKIQSQSNGAPPNSPASETASSSIARMKAPARRAPAHPQIVKTPVTTNSTSVIREALARGDYFFERGEYDSAIQAYEGGLAHDPSNQKLMDGIARAKRAKAAEAKFLSQ